MSEDSAVGSPGYPSRVYAFFVIAVLIVASVHAQLDKQFPGLMVGPIREHFGISDTQFSLFHGAGRRAYVATRNSLIEQPGIAVRAA